MPAACMSASASSPRKASPRSKGKSPESGTHCTVARPPPPDPKTLPVHLNGKSRERRLAEVAIEPATASAAIAGWMTKGTFGETGIGDLVEVLRDSVENAQVGELGEYEGMLGAQAHALNAIFLEMTRRAALNMNQHLSATETYMRLALKAQSQARTTVESLAEIKNPRPVAFVRQANIANGPQQVNNGEGRAGQPGFPPNELQEEQHGQRMASGPKAPRLGVDQGSATVVAIDRPADARRQG